MQQERLSTSSRKPSATPSTNEEAPPKGRSDEQQELINYSDELLDEIDGLLSGLDENLAATFVQAPGE